MKFQPRKGFSTLNPYLNRPLLAVLAVLLLLAACAPGQPVPSAEEIEAQIATSVALTVAAQQAAQPTPAFTPTSIPTATFTPTPLVLPPTVTPFVVVPPTSGYSGGGGGGGAGSSPTYSCDPDIGKRPFDNSIFKPGDSFDIKFTIKNTGTATWPAGYDLVYFSGPNMAPAFPAVIELPEMDPGDMFAVGPYDATAPGEEGFHVMTFKLQGGFCYPYVAIRVQKPPGDP